MCRYMKSSILVLVISTLVLAAGCTRLPASEETGLGPESMKVLSIPKKSRRKM